MVVPVGVLSAGGSGRRGRSSPLPIGYPPYRQRDGVRGQLGPLLDHGGATPQDGAGGRETPQLPEGTGGVPLVGVAGAGASRDKSARTVRLGKTPRNASAVMGRAGWDTALSAN